MGKISIRRWCASGATVALMALSACGGGGSGDPTANPPADPNAASTTVGTTGGTVTNANGVSITIPAGALGADTTIRVAKDATGAPALPTSPGLRAVGDMLALTPHGSTFSSDVKLSVPAPKVTLANNEELRLAKAQPGGKWLVLPTTQEGGKLVATVRSFSFVTPVVVAYSQPVTNLRPLTVQLSEPMCNGTPCKDISNGVGPWQVQITVTTNGGQLPTSVSAPAMLTISCTHGSFRLGVAPGILDVSQQTLQSGTVTSWTVSFNAPPPTSWLQCQAEVGSGLMAANSLSYRYGEIFTHWSYPNRAVNNGGLWIVQWPRTAATIAGAPVTLTAEFWVDDHMYDGHKDSAGIFVPTEDAQTQVTWQRSGDGGSSWVEVGASRQTDGQQVIYPPDGARPATKPWEFWTASHGFTASDADNGSLWRLQACWVDKASTAQPPCITSSALRLSVQPYGTAPALTQQPRDMMVQRGQTASFTAVATASPDVSGWQWQSRAANSTGAWTDIAGATSATYTTPTLTLADNGAQYRVLATNAVGTTASDTVTASVSDTAVPPSFTAQPVSLSVITGSEAVFAVAARGTEGLSYQWRKNGTPISGANASTLKLPAVAAGDAGAYSVVVTNVAGSITSQDGTLAVGAAVAPVLAPSIVTAPAAVQVHVGDTATFAVGVGNAGPGLLGFQWFKDGNPIAGAGQAVLTLNAVTLADAGRYSVSVTNAGGGDMSTTATLTVLPSGGSTVAPSIDTPPATLTVSPGLAATLAVGASGSGPLSYQWSFNGTAIPGATSATLTLPAVSVSDAGVYRVTVSNSAGSVLSSTAQIIVVGAPAITADLADISVADGDLTTFSVSATGDALHYVWLYNGEPYAGTTDSPTLSVPVTLADNGSHWRVLAFNGAGIAFSRTATLTVTAAPVTTSCTGTGNTGWCSTPVTANPSHVAFGSPNVGLAVEMYADAQVLRTTDGGVTWTPQEALHTTRNFYAYGLAFADANTAILSGLDANSGAATILRSVDAGLTWTEVYTSAFGTLSGYLGKPVFLNANVGLVPANAQLLRTTDGGATWSVLQLGTGQWLNELMALPGGAVLGQGGDPTYVPGASTQARLLRSSDGGQTWGVWGPPTSGTLLQYLGGMSFVDDLTGMALINAASGGTAARLARTTDGGRSWAISDIAGTSGMFSGVTMAADGTGVAMNGNVLMRTADAGATWLAVNPGTAQGLAAAATPSPGVFVVVGNQVILRNTQGGAGP